MILHVLYVLLENTHRSGFYVHVISDLLINVHAVYFRPE